MNVLKILAIIIIVVSFAVCVNWVFLAINSHNINMDYIIQSITCFIMGIGLTIMLYFEW